MKRRMGIAWILVLTLALMGMSAHAMPIKFDGGSFTASASLVSDGSAFELDADKIQLLGTDDDGSYYVFANGQFLKLNQSALESVINAIGSAAVEELPKIGDYGTLQRRNRGDAVVKMQQNLIKLGYMKGEADGDFGGISERAISALQTELGLEATGIADPLMQMLIESMNAFERTIELNVDPLARYAEIVGKTNLDLEKIAELGWTLTIDDISGTGMLTNGNKLNYKVSAGSDIDSRTFALSFGLSLEQDAAGQYNTIPVLDITAVGVQRPVMQEITFKSGNARVSLPLTILRNGLSGLNAEEVARAALNADAVNLIAKAAETGELKLRLACKYDSYDIAATSYNLDAISEIGEVAQGLN